MYKKGDSVDIKGMEVLKKEHPIKVTMAKLEESTMSPSVLLALLQTSKLWAARRVNARSEYMMYSKSHSFLSWLQENDHRKKEAKKKGSQVQWPCQPTPPGED